MIRYCPGGTITRSHPTATPRYTTAYVVWSSLKKPPELAAMRATRYDWAGWGGTDEIGCVQVWTRSTVGSRSSSADPPPVTPPSDWAQQNPLSAKTAFTLNTADESCRGFPHRYWKWSSRSSPARYAPKNDV